MQQFSGPQGTMTVEEAAKYFALYHPQLPIVVELPDGTHVGITGATRTTLVSDDKNINYLCLQTVNGPFGEKRPPVVVAAAPEVKP